MVGLRWTGRSAVYKKRLLERTEHFLRRMRWKAFHYLNPVTTADKETFGFNLLSQLKQLLGIEIGLYRDDGCAVLNQTPREVERAKKKGQIFARNNLKITIEANKKVVNFLDVTLKPYTKPLKHHFTFTANRTTLLISLETYLQQLTGDYPAFHLIKPSSTKQRHRTKKRWERVDTCTRLNSSLHHRDHRHKNACDEEMLDGSTRRVIKTSKPISEDSSPLIRFVVYK